MNVAFALALFTFTLNFAMAVGHLAVSRAPGWRSSRAFSQVAFFACLYSAGNMVSATQGLPFWVYIVGIRGSYLVAHLHALAWYPLAFGGPDASFAGLSRPLQRWVRVSMGVAGFFLLTGLQTRLPFYFLVVPWAHVTYHFVTTTPLGDAYGAMLLVTLALPFAQFVRRWRAGEAELLWVVAGFAVFFACAVVEVLVASGVFQSLSPADLGFLAVVVPTSAQLIRRFNHDARRLDALSADLAGQVRERTGQLEQARTALAEAEHLASLGRLAAGVGHEINNPLTYVQLSLEEVEEHLRDTQAPAPVQGALANAFSGTQRIQRVVEGLRTYSRHGGQFVPLDPHDVARAALVVAEPHTRGVRTLETRFEDAPRIMGDAPRLAQAVAALVVNAAQAVAGQPGGGHVVVRVAAGIQGECRFEIEDDGPGIPAALRARVLEPYFTTRASDGGMGLGLFVARGIVDAHAGCIGLEDAPGRGVRAVIALPPFVPGLLHVQPMLGAIAAPAHAPAAPPAPPAKRSAVRPRVLVVDDEPLVLRLLGRTLEAEWDVVQATSGTEALALARDTAFDAILCDLMMPGFSGIQLAEQLEADAPGLRRRMVFLTGGAVSPEAQAFVARPDVLHVLKPVDLAELTRALRAVAGSRGA